MIGMSCNNTNEQKTKDNVKILKKDSDFVIKHGLSDKRHSISPENLSL